MASEIKVDNIKDQCGTAVITKCGATHTVTAEVYKADTIQDTSGNAYLAKCGTTVTLGGCGQTIALAAGASQTGFGRTGTVDWDTTAKTAAFTAVSGNGYFVNTTSGAITVTLPATPSAGDIVAVADYAGTATTNNITIARNGSNFQGGTDDGVIAVNRQTATFVYVDATQGWLSVNSNDQGFEVPAYITATGGTVTCCGNYKIHTFTGPGTFTVTCAGNPTGSSTVDYLVVAGGGGSGGQGGQSSGGGGAGGYRESSGAAGGGYTVSPLGCGVSALPVSATGYPITVGSGGAGGTAGSDNNGNAGSNSVFSTITSAGGGYGAGSSGPSPGGNGGSGGGGRNNGTGGTGNTPPVTPPQGNDGGDSDQHSGSGGGGATTPGANSNGPGQPSGNGGTGATSSINATPTERAGGGAGGFSPTSPASGTSSGGGGPGVGPSGPPTTANGTANTGGGAGGVGFGPLAGATGGSGIVIIRYKFQ